MNSPGTIKKHVGTYSLSLKPDEELKNTRKLDNHDTHCLMKMMMMIIITMMMMMMLMVVVVVAMRMIHPDSIQIASRWILNKAKCNDDDDDDDDDNDDTDNYINNCTNY